jgi:putative tryptophan/tyrosine transport system substrate-binding protein
MQVFVTGANGFIGGAVAAALIAAGHKVRGLVRNKAIPALAGDLVDRQVDVIAAVGGEPCVFAVKATRSSNPVVFIAGGDPVAMGFVASIARPGGNMTGVNMFSIELQAKRLGLLNELTRPGATIALFIDPGFLPSDNMANEIQKAAHQVGREVITLKTSTEHEIDEAFAVISEKRVGGLLAGAGPFFNSRRNQLVALAARYAIPTIYEFRESSLAGGLISYGTSLPDAYRQSGIYTGRVLKGERPADMPVLQPTKFELVINLTTAKALGLDVPDKWLAIADEVIE